MSRPDILTCVHEPFGDAYYFGPERLSSRYEHDEKAREESGFSNCTFKAIFERIEQERNEVRLPSASPSSWLHLHRIYCSVVNPGIETSHKQVLKWRPHILVQLLLYSPVETYTLRQCCGSIDCIIIWFPPYPDNIPNHFADSDSLIRSSWISL